MVYVYIFANFILFNLPVSSVHIIVKGHHLNTFLTNLVISRATKDRYLFDSEPSGGVYIMWMNSYAAYTPKRHYLWIYVKTTGK
jgi:hypothetical protein